MGGDWGMMALMRPRCLGIIGEGFRISIMFEVSSKSSFGVSFGIENNGKGEEGRRGGSCVTEVLKRRQGFDTKVVWNSSLLE
jgi:hypothetical protein